MHYDIIHHRILIFIFLNLEKRPSEMRVFFLFEKPFAQKQDFFYFFGFKTSK